MKRAAAAGVVVFLLLALLVLTQESPAPRRDGKWNVTMESDVTAEKPSPPITFTLCKTKAEAEDPETLVPLTNRVGKEDKEKQQSNCKVSDQKLEGATVTWTAHCEGVTGVGEFVYSTDRFVGTMNVTLSRKGQPFTMTNKYTGVRLGDCEESTPTEPVIVR